MDAAALRRFEEACEWLARGDNARKHEAEAVLMDFRKQPGAIDGATAIVGSSPHVFVQFQAALLLRHAALDQWDSLGAEERVQLRRAVLRMVVERSDDFHRTVRKQLLQALAVMWKRGWLDDRNDASLAQAKQELFAQIGSLLEAAGDRQQQLSMRHAVALQLLAALVEEFSSSKASALGLSLAFHRECHESFERAGLMEAFSLAAKLLRNVVGPGASTTPPSGPATEEVIRSSLSLLESCLAWDFQCGDSGSQADRTFRVESALVRGRAHAAGHESGTIRPGAGWRQVLLNERLLETLFRLYAVSRQASVGHAGAGEDIAHQIRQLLIMLASVNGHVFSDAGQRADYINALLRGSLFSVIENPLVPVHVAAGLSQTFASTAAADSKEALCAAGGAEYLDMCALLARLASNFTVEDFVAARGAQRAGEAPAALPRVLSALSQLSKSILEGAARNAAGPGVDGGAPAAPGHARTHDDDDDVDNSWLMEAFGSLLEVWTAFTAWADALSAGSASRDAPPSPLETEAHRVICEAAGDLYQFYLEKRLAMARASMEREAFETFEEEFAEDESALDDHLLAVASLGRADVVRAMMANTAALQRLSADLMASASQPWSEASSMQCSQVAEQLFWVVLLASFLLADPADGERPMIPTCIIAASMRFCAQVGPASAMTRQAAAEDPCVKLSQALLHLLQFESERVRASKGEDERVSPLLSSKLLAAVTRWSMTYLLPERGLYSKSTRIQDGLPPSIDMCFAQTEQAEELIGFLVQSASYYVSNWGTETSVNPEALGLLRAIVDNPACRGLLQRMSSWGSLCEAHVRSVRDPNWCPLDGLTVQGQGTLLQILLMSLEIGREAPEPRRAQIQGLFAQLVEPVQQRLDALASRLVTDAQRAGGKESVGSALSDPHFLQDLQRLMNMYLGAVQAASFGPLATWCREFVLGALSSRWTQISAAALTFIKRDGLNAAVSGSARRVISEVLELVEAFMDAQLGSTPSTQFLPAFEAADRVLQVFAEFQRHLTANPGQFKAGEEDAWCQDVLRLMRVIRHVTVRDQLDFSEGPSEDAAGPQPVQVVMKGVQLIFPLVTKELLQFPGIAEEFFTLLKNLVDTYPSHFAGLSKDMFNPVLQALEFGMVDHRVTVSRNSFEALSCLAEFHVEQTAAGAPGLGPNLYPNGPGSPSVLLHMLQQVFNFIVFQTFDSSLLNPAANAMLALIASEQSNFTPMVEQIIASQDDPAMRDRLSRAFTGLVQNNDVQLRLDRVNRRRFQRNVVDFVNQVRGFMRKK